MACGRGIDQLGGDTNAVPAATHAPFKHIAHAEVTRDLSNVNRTPFVSETGVASDYEQVPGTGQGRGDLFHHAVGEVVLLRVAADVGEWQHSNRGLVRNGEGGLWRLNAFRDRQARLLLLPHLAYETQSLARQSLDQTLFFTVV